MTLADLVAALRRFRWLALATFSVILLLGIASAVLPSTRYESSTVLSVQPVGQEAGFDSQQAIQIVIPTIIARVTSAGFTGVVRNDIEDRFKTEPIEASAASDPGTAIVRLDVRSDTPDGARAAADSAVRVLVDQQRTSGFVATILNPPQPATSVKARRTPRIIGGALVFGLIVATLLAAFLHRMRPPLPGGADFRTRYNHHVLGEIPRAQPGTNDAGIAEAFRSLETRIRQGILARGGDPAACSIAITSWTALEGKSTVTANLATTIAAYGGPVTAVDCDLRRPSLHELLNVARTPGMADGPPVMKLRQPGGAPSLDVIAAGEPQRHPSEIVSEMVPLLLPLLHDRAVLLDTPPMFTAETTTIAGAADYLVLVADYPSRKPEELDEALDELALSSTPVLGVVFNRSDTDDGRGRDAYVYRPPVTEPTPLA